MPQDSDLMDNLDGFLRRVKAVLREKEMSQAELSRSLGVGQATVSEWFTRHRVPNGAVLLQLPGVLGVNGHWLLTGEGSRVPHVGSDDPYTYAVEDIVGEIMDACQRLRTKHGAETGPGNSTHAR